VFVGGTVVDLGVLVGGALGWVGVLVADAVVGAAVAGLVPVGDGLEEDNGGVSTLSVVDDVVPEPERGGVSLTGCTPAQRSPLVVEELVPVALAVGETTDSAASGSADA
jgi:hypothetical protein